VYLIGFGFHQYLWAITDNIISEMTFLLIVVVAVDQIDRLVEQPEHERKWWKLLLLGLLTYLAFGTRTVGALLLPLPLVLDLIKHRRVSLRLALMAILPAALIALQWALIPGVGSYFEQLPGTIMAFLQMIVTTSAMYIAILSYFIAFDSFILQGMVFIPMLLFALVGFYRQIRHQFGAVELFFILYLISVVLWPEEVFRYLLPILPFYFLYVLKGLEHFLSQFARQRWVKPAVYLLLGIGFLVYHTGSFFEMTRNRVYDIYQPTTQELFQAVREQTDEDDLIIFFKPRVLAMYTGRYSAMIMLPDSDGDPIGRLQELGADYVIVSLTNEQEWQPEMRDMVAQYAEAFELFYENSAFRAYRFTP
ncbi:MAG: hypothetical protein JW750_09700, partial [Anaerolineaceae bacterium]|nr:hypothetical protein [Anaerolineaceae bacterium]